MKYFEDGDRCRFNKVESEILCSNAGKGKRKKRMSVAQDCHGPSRKSIAFGTHKRGKGLVPSLRRAIGKE